MAIWQFTIELVPSKTVNGRSEVTREELDNGAWWKDCQPPSNYIDRLKSIKPQSDSWSPNFLYFGSDQGDRIDVFLSDDRVESLSFRIDCRNLSPAFIKDILSLCQEWNCGLIEWRYQKILPLAYEEFCRVIVEAPELRFMEDPKSWLPKLAEELENH